MKRREFLKGTVIVGAGMAVAPSLVSAKTKSPYEMGIDSALKAITNGKKAKHSSAISLKVPNIAENGKVVPVKISIDHPMEAGNYIKTINLLTSKNGNARCATVHLTPANGEAYYSCRIKLGGSQDVIVVAETNKGKFITAKAPVKVTIGGCG
jgi:sulfur-oxidizing protein SoxY